MAKISKEELYQLYVVEKRSSTNIARLKNCSDGAIRNYLRSYDISLRDKKECRTDSVVTQIKETNMKKFGVDNPLKSEEIKQQVKQTNLERYGTENAFQNPQVQDKYKNTMLSTYGVEHNWASKEIIQRREDNLLNKYGVTNVFQLDFVKEKSKETSLSKYGVIHNSLNQDSIKKRKITNLERYGTEYIFQSEIIKSKSKETLLQKYGVENPSHSPEILSKILTTGLSKKEYMLPSSNVIYVQGYEPKMLDVLLLQEKVEELDIITGIENVPVISWFDDTTNKTRKHFPDIFIQSQNRLIEVKSSWYARKEMLPKLLKRKEAAELLGYKYELMVFVGDNHYEIS